MKIKHRWIKGYEKVFSISEQGTIYAHSRVTTHGRLLKGKFLHPRPDKDGYLRVGLQLNGKRKFHSVHRLVAQAFIPNPENLPEINHKNKDRQDNAIDNLEWCTRQQNVKHQYTTKEKRNG